LNLNNNLIKHLSYINKITKKCVINDEVSSSTLVEDLASHD
jgi:hypothetical protein